jgi:hypothetical protein
MIQFIVPIALILGYYLLRNAMDKRPKQKSAPKKKALFNSHTAEIRDLIYRCQSLSEWSILDQEITWLEDTWRNKIEAATLQQESGKLYTKWLDKGIELRKLQTPKIAS